MVIESFLMIKGFKKFNQERKFYYLNNKIAISIASTFFSYFLIPAFYEDGKIKTSLINQISDKYDIKLNLMKK